VRIIAGKKRGMKLLAPKAGPTRPITDRVKESLFNVLSNYGLPRGCIVADLFCGVGSLGLEALSRDAECVTFVEKDPGVAAVLAKNIAKAGFGDRSTVIVASVFSIGAPLRDKQRHDLVFVDPPYAETAETGVGSTLDKLLAIVSQQITTDAVVVVRTQRKTRLVNRYGRLGVLERREWGTMAVTLLSMIRDDG